MWDTFTGVMPLGMCTSGMGFTLFLIRIHLVLQYIKLNSMTRGMLHTIRLFSNSVEAP